MKKTYADRKEAARQKAIEWQYEWANEVHYTSEDAEWTAYFRKLGKRYGLIREFEENGIL